MNNIQLINYIATYNKFTNIVINGEDDKTPMEAIEYLSCDNSINNEWEINDYIFPNTLLCYKL
jgi:hypothetical protein